MVSQTARTEELVDLILKLVGVGQDSPDIRLLVGHQYPDDDVWLCCWMTRKFIPKAGKAQIAFVNAGERLPGSEDDPSVMHFDTGGGEYDQHGKGLSKTASAVLVAEKLGLIEKYPGIKPLLEMVTATDNVEPLPPTSIHYFIEGLPRKHRNSDGTFNWTEIQERIFEAFDIIYELEAQRIASRANLSKFAEWTTLPNGTKMAALLWHPELREAAFEAGAMIVVWTQRMWRHADTGETVTDGALRAKAKLAGITGSKVPEWTRSQNWKPVFYTGVQRNRGCPKLGLNGVAASLRRHEEGVQNVTYTRSRDDPYAVGRQGRWFLHDSLGLVLNGSRSWTLAENEYTNLSPREILGEVCHALSRIPQTVVSGWNK